MDPSVKNAGGIAAESSNLHSKDLLILRVVLAATFIACIWGNFVLAPLQGQVILKHPSVLTPAPTAFSIWSVIYVFVCAFVVRECIAPSQTMPRVQLKWLYALTSVLNLLNISWLATFSYGWIAFSSVVIVLTWLTSFALYMIVIENVEPPHFVATVSLHRATRQNDYPCTSLTDYICIRLPFTLYCSWLCGATLIGVSLGLSELGVPMEMYIYISAFTLLLMGHIVALLWQGDVVFAAVGMWTLIWQQVECARRKVLVVDDVQEYAEITAVQVMATLGLSILISLTIVLFIVRCGINPSSGFNSSAAAAPTYGAI